MPSIFLIVQRGEDIGQKINLEQARSSIGRNPDNYIILDDGLVSRYHAVIVKDANGQVSITDLNSTNGVMVNERVILKNVPAPLKHRDLIVIGSNVFNVQVRPDGYVSPPLPGKDDPKATKYFQYKKLFS